MRRFTMMSLLSLAAALPLAAQFEGVITMSMQSGSPAPIEMKYYIKGNLLAASVAMASGPMAGQSVHMIYDLPGRKVTVLIPMAMGNAKGMKSVIDLNKMAANATDHSIDIKPLGSSQTIAGYKCDDYEVSDQGKSATRLCISRELGHFAIASMGRMGGGAAAPAWARVFGEKPGFPLKVWSVDGKLNMEATSIQKGHVPADVFTIPDGYMELPSMGGTGRGPAGP